MKYYKFILLVFIIPLFLSCSKSNESEFYNYTDITIIALDADTEQPITEAEVSLVYGPPDNRSVQTKNTDSNGKAIFYQIYTIWKMTLNIQKVDQSQSPQYLYIYQETDFDAGAKKELTYTVKIKNGL